MKIGIISDIHGSLLAFENAIEVLADIDVLICAGDILYHGPRNPLPEGHSPGDLAKQINKLNIPFIAAKGNCDAEIDQKVLSVPILSPYALCHFENKSFLVTHGHRSTKEQLQNLAIKWSIDIVITGHTHIKTLANYNDIIFVNPGSCSLPKDHSPSIAKIEDGNIKLIDLKTGKVLDKIQIR